MPAATRIYVQTAHIIAAALDDAEDIKTQAAITSIARQLADMFKADSAEFRYDRFFPACRLDPWGEPTSNPVSNGTNGGSHG
jgi:hypothetical protein